MVEAEEATVGGMEWPTHFPRGCPGERGVEIGGELFRLIANRSHVVARDIESYLQSGELPNAPPCNRAALSFDYTIEDARRRMSISKRFSGWGIAAATFTAADGRMHRADTAHVRVWLRREPLEGLMERLRVINEELETS
jgi:hypothetical protein